MTDEKLRLFTAVRVPDEQLEWLEAATADLRGIEGARWTGASGRHVTLNFLGWIPSAGVDRVIEAVDAAAGRHEAAPATLAGLGTFPRERRARVLWAGVNDPAGLLPALARDLGEALRPAGYEPEDRPYTAHVTLARFKTPRSLAGLLPDLPEAPAAFAVDRVTLFRSRLSPSGSRYEVVHEAYLGAEGVTDAGRSQ